MFKLTEAQEIGRERIEKRQNGVKGEKEGDVKDEHESAFLDDADISSASFLAILDPPNPFLVSRRLYYVSVTHRASSDQQIPLHVLLATPCAISTSSLLVPVSDTKKVNGTDVSVSGVVSGLSQPSGTTGTPNFTSYGNTTFTALVLRTNRTSAGLAGAAQVLSHYRSSTPTYCNIIVTLSRPSKFGAIVILWVVDDMIAGGQVVSQPVVAVTREENDVERFNVAEAVDRVAGNMGDKWGWVIKGFGNVTYSPLYEPPDCMAAYRAWLCASLFPRCAPSPSNPSFATIVPNSLIARDPRSDPPHSARGVSAGRVLQVHDTPFPENAASAPPPPKALPILAGALNDTGAYLPYTELLPCVDLCWLVMRACPRFAGFRCPRGRSGMGQYGVGGPAGCSAVGWLEEREMMKDYG
ncbi:stretch-activated cation channel mid1 [Gonapodya sp. JEL0774]|nr:stretch-activated cation channel mid1 [Gonapodya sp. JEL0774]